MPGFRAILLSVLRRWIGVQPTTPPLPQTASRGFANLHKVASKGSAAPSKSAHKGSAGPLKTMASKDDSSSSSCSPTKVRVDGVLVDVEGFSHPRRSATSSRPQVPPKPVASHRLKKAEQNPTSFLPYPMMRWTRHQFFKDEIMIYFIILWFLRGFWFNFEEMNPLAGWYEGAMIEVQETCFSA